MSCSYDDFEELPLSDGWVVFSSEENDENRFRGFFTDEDDADKFASSLPRHLEVLVVAAVFIADRIWVPPPGILTSHDTLRGSVERFVNEARR